MKPDLKKLIITNLPYLLFVWLFGKMGEAWRLAAGADASQKMLHFMAHGAATNSIELTGAPKEFDRVARKWNVDYAFYKTGPDKYLLFFKSGQADAITACFSEYSRRVLDKAKTDRVPIREQLRRAAAEILRQPAPQRKDRVKEAAHEDR